MTQRTQRPRPPTVCVVTVTYGHRWHLLQPVLESLASSSADHILLVDNGCDWDVPRTATEHFGNRIQVIQTGRNKGSAGGFASGLAEAYRSGADLIWLLDDDNLAGPDTLPRLLAAYRYLGGTPDNALVAFRPQWAVQQRAVRTGQDRTVVPNRFLGFHIADAPDWFRRRALGKSAAALFGPPRFPLVPIQCAPYGGLLIHRTWVDRIGLPDERWFLYQDDAMYTHRIINQGGRILLCASAEINDTEASWSVATRHLAPLFSPDVEDWKLYYLVRNLVAFETLHVSRPLVHLVNRFVTIYGSFVLALLGGLNPPVALRRLSVVRHAVHHGSRGMLEPPTELVGDHRN